MIAKNFGILPRCFDWLPRFLIGFQGFQLAAKVVGRLQKFPVDFQGFLLVTKVLGRLSKNHGN